MLIGATALGLVSLSAAGKALPQMTVERPGAVRPAGWLRDRAEAAKAGFTGHMEEIDEDFRIAWTTNGIRRGKQLNWTRGTGSWSAEGGAYWFEGLVKLAWQLDDPELKRLSARRLEPLLANMNDNAIGFLWWLDRRNPKEVEEAFGPGDWQFWVFGMAERVVAAYGRASGDPRAKRVLRQAFDFEEMGRRKGGMAPLASGVAEAARLTGSPEVAKTLEACYGKLTNSPFARPPLPFLEQTLNLKRYHEQSGVKFASRHGVWAEESLMSVLALYEATGEVRYRDAVVAWYDFFDRHCRQPYGVTMMDEEWGWAGASRGTETCDVAAEMTTRLRLLACLGDGRWADDVELAFFNAGPGCVSRDFRRHVYHQLPNRVAAPDESKLFSCGNHEHTLYRDKHWPLCCTAVLNRILPNYVEAMWMRTADGGVAAALYGPSSFTADLPSGRIAFEETTDYPFDETVVLTVREAPAAAFPLKVRVPSWCAAAEIAVNGEPLGEAGIPPAQNTVNDASPGRTGVPPVLNGFATLNRVWKPGDRVTLRFPMKPRVCAWRDLNDFGRERRSLYLGPLLFAVAVPEKDDNTPAGVVKEPLLPVGFDVKDIAVVRSPLPRPWTWSTAAAPVKLRIADAGGAPLELVPYGCAKLRFSALAIQAKGDGCR